MNDGGSSVNILPETLATIWESRQCGQLDTVRDFWRKIESECAAKFSARPSAILHHAAFVDCDITTKLDLVFLGISMLRRDATPAIAQKEIEDVARWLDSINQPKTFQFHFQSGLNQLAMTNRTHALQDFLQAKEHSRTEMEQLFARTNVVLCCEDLGFPIETDLHWLNAKLPSFANCIWHSSIAAELDALKLRHAFRIYDLDKISELAKSGVIGDQANSFLLWILSLPHLELTVAEENLQEKLLEKLIHRLNSGYLVGYDVRTLQGLAVIEDDDNEQVRISEQIERLYLWCWRWLANGDEHNFSKILHLIAVIKERKSTVLSIDDYLKLENSLHWLTIFSDHTERDAMRLSKTHTFSHLKPSPLLEFERTFLQWLMAMKQRKSQEAQIHLEELQRTQDKFQSGSFLLSKIVASGFSTAMSASFDKKWQPLLAGTRSLWGDDEHLPTGITINLSHHDLINNSPPAPSHSIKSPALAALFALAAQQNLLSADLVMNAAFGMPKFNKERHLEKLGKLLVQANKCGSPFFNFTRREQKIFVKGEMNHLKIIGNGPHRQCWLAFGGSSEVFTGESERSNASRSQQTASEGEWLSRSDIESLFRLSKSATVERISELIEAGKLERQGKGRSTRYRILSKIF
jgi:hypothetical protein